MKKLHPIIFAVIVALLLPAFQLFSQTRVYSVTSGELLFQWADIAYTDAAANDPNYQFVGNPLRFTCFFHFGQYVNVDFTNSVGFFTGLAVRNVGFISDERINRSAAGDPANMQDFKTIRRSYTLGIPFALKFGSFSNHTYLFAGGEIEMAYAYKEKFWNSHSRSGTKSKTTQWFGAQTPTFIPSVFAGIQFPGGINVKFKYYLDNFINTDYTSQNPVSDLTRYKTTQVMYVSLSWHFNTAYITKKQWKAEDKFSSL